MRDLMQDAGLVLLSVVIALILAGTDALTGLLDASRELERLGSFIAGIFFTSVFTAAPAVVALGEIAKIHSLFETAAIGAAGAVVGDLIIFKFVRDRLSAHLIEVLGYPERGERLKAILKLRFFRWFTFLLGGLIVASPLPDEIGVALLGFSKPKTSLFIPLSFVFNFLGIYAVGAIARSL